MKSQGTVPRPAGRGRAGGPGGRAPSHRPCSTTRSSRTDASTSSRAGRGSRRSRRAGVPRSALAITRPGYGPNGETVVFDSRTPSTSYNYKHGLPGEYFRSEGSAKSPFARGQVQRTDVRGLLLVRQVAPRPDQRRQQEQRPGAAGLLVSAASTSPTTCSSARSSRPASGSR